MRLRYRLQDGRILWTYQWFRTDDILDRAIEQVCGDVAESTELPLLMGKPE